MDHTKRKTLKILSGLSASAVGSSAITAAADTGLYNNRLSGTHSHTENLHANNLLRIDVLASKSAPEDTVVMASLSNRTITVGEFLPGMITFKNQMMDLNQIIKDDKLTIEPGYPVATKIARWEMLALTDSSHYLQSDDSYTEISSDTQIIRIIAKVSHQRASLTLIHPGIVTSLKSNGIDVFA